MSKKAIKALIWTFSHEMSSAVLVSLKQERDEEPSREESPRIQGFKGSPGLEEGGPRVQPGFKSSPSRDEGPRHRLPPVVCAPRQAATQLLQPVKVEQYNYII